MSGKMSNRLTDGMSHGMPENGSNRMPDKSKKCKMEFPDGMPDLCQIACHIHIYIFKYVKQYMKKVR